MTTTTEYRITTNNPAWTRIVHEASVNDACRRFSEVLPMVSEQPVESLAELASAIESTGGWLAVWNGPAKLLYISEGV